MTAFPVHDEAHDAFMALPPYTGIKEVRTTQTRAKESMKKTTGERGKDVKDTLD